MVSCFWNSLLGVGVVSFCRKPGLVLLHFPKLVLVCCNFVRDWSWLDHLWFGVKIIKFLWPSLIITSMCEHICSSSPHAVHGLGKMEGQLNWSLAATVNTFGQF